MSRPKLHVIKGGGEGGDPNLRRWLDSDLVSTETSTSLSKLINDPGYKIPSLERRIGVPKKSLPYGTCHELHLQVAETGKTRVLIIDEAFPEDLPEIVKLQDKEEAYLSAAIYIRAYDVIARAISRANRLRQISNYTLEPLAKLSKPEAWHPTQARSVMIVPYRAAGLVTRRAMGLTEGDFREDYSAMPVHIAGLVDPLPVNPVAGGPTVGFSALSDVIKKGI